MKVTATCTLIKKSELKHITVETIQNDTEREQNNRKKKITSNTQPPSDLWNNNKLSLFNCRSRRNEENIWGRKNIGRNSWDFPKCIKNL